MHELAMTHRQWPIEPAAFSVNQERLNLFGRVLIRQWLGSWADIGLRCSKCLRLIIDAAVNNLHARQVSSIHGYKARVLGSFKIKLPRHC